MVVVASTADMIAPYSEVEINLAAKHRPPWFVSGGSAAHLLGTDHLGRDVLSRMIVGSQVTLVKAVAVIAVSGLIGISLGLFSGYLGGWIDAFVMRVVDATLAFPAFLLALVLVVRLGPRP